jgi:rhodanese-related sulfurtransferase
MAISSVSVHELAALLGSRPIRLVDVRTPAEFAAVHAEGATLDRIDPAAVPAPTAGPAEPLYLICASGTRSRLAAERLLAGGVGEPVVVEGGTSAWERAGLPVRRGPCRAISLERQVRIAAGSLVLAGLAIGWFVHPAGLALSAFVGAGLVFAGITDFCGMGLLLARMPWNRAAA